MTRRVVTNMSLSLLFNVSLPDGRWELASHAAGADGKLSLVCDSVR